MKKYKTEFYDYEAGVEYSLRWANKQQYSQAIAFLQELTGCNPERSETKSELSSYFLLKSRKQVDALSEFRRRLLAGQ